MNKYLFIIIALIMFHDYAIAFDGFNVEYISTPSNIRGVSLGLGNKANNDQYSIMSYSINKNGLFSYLGQDSVYFLAGQAYMFEYKKRHNIEQFKNAYYYLGYRCGAIWFWGNGFDELHPIFLGNAGVGLKREVLNGEIYCEGALGAGFITYIRSTIDLFFKFRPDFAYDYTFRLGYRMNI